MIPAKYTCDGQDVSPPLSWSGVPDNAKSLVLISDDPGAMKAALEQVGDGKPLIYAATADNLDAMAQLATEHSCPLTVRASGLEALAELSARAAEAGVEDLVLDPQPETQGDAVRQQTSRQSWTEQL